MQHKHESIYMYKKKIVSISQWVLNHDGMHDIDV